MTIKTPAVMAAITVSLLAAACAPRQQAYPIFPAETTAARNVDFDEGYIRSRGLDVPRDYARAIEAYRKAAEAGDGRAMNNLGVMALQGRGLGPGRSEAVSWFEKAVDAGSAAASYNLGLLAEFGVSSGSSGGAAHFYRIASAQGHALAQKRLAGLSDGGEARRQTELSALSGDKASVDQVRSGASTRYRDARAVIGLLAEDHCVDCSKTDKSISSSAMKNLHALAEKGDAPALYDLGVHHLKGDQTVQDSSKAARYFSLAAKKGYAPAALELARMHLRGEAVAYNPVVAHSLLNLAARETGSVGEAARNEMDSLEAKMSRSDVEKAQQLANKRAVSGQ
jgi:TPR repeat protein